VQVVPVNSTHSKAFEGVSGDDSIVNDPCLFCNTGAEKSISHEKSLSTQIYLYYLCMLISDLWGRGLADIVDAKPNLGFQASIHVMVEALAAINVFDFTSMGRGIDETSKTRSVGVGGWSFCRGRCAGGRSASEGQAGRICEGARGLGNLDKIGITSLACGASDTSQMYHCI